MQNQKIKQNQKNVKPKNVKPKNAKLKNTKPKNAKSKNVKPKSCFWHVVSGLPYVPVLHCKFT